MKLLALHVTAQSAAWFLLFALAMVCLALWMSYVEDKS